MGALKLSPLNKNETQDVETLNVEKLCLLLFLLSEEKIVKRRSTFLSNRMDRKKNTRAFSEERER